MTDRERTFRRAAMALQTAAVRKGNGLATARVCYASNGYDGRYGAHVTCSAYVPLHTRAA